MFRFSQRSVRKRVLFILLTAVLLSAGSAAVSAVNGPKEALNPNEPKAFTGEHPSIPMNALNAVAPAGVPPAPAAAPVLSPADLDLLARCISGESRGEPYTGQVAVGAVILNRVKSPAFPNTVREVIFAANQFEVVRNGQINLRPAESSVAAAKAALLGEDPTSGAVYFFDPSKTRNAFLWSRPHKITIGGHRFTG